MTLFADASYHPGTGAAGWGSWAIRDDWDKGRFNGGEARLRDCRITSSNSAEIIGIALALWKHHKQGDLDIVTEIMIQCDNIMALGYVRRRIRRSVVTFAKGVKKVPIFKQEWKRVELDAVMDTIAMILDGKAVKLRHVRGHQDPSKGGRAWVNDHCDREAKRHQRALRIKMLAGPLDLD